jgi:hypothetical protein
LHPQSVILGRDMTPSFDGPDQAPRATKLWRAGSLAYTRPGLFALFFWLLWGDFAYFLKERSVPMTVQLLLHRYQVSDFLAGALLGTLPMAVGILAGPLVAYHSDRHRGPWGRRIPFLIAPIPWEGSIGLLAWAALLMVYRKFQLYGGARSYVAPA